MRGFLGSGYNPQMGMWDMAGQGLMMGLMQGMQQKQEENLFRDLGSATKKNNPDLGGQVTLSDNTPMGYGVKQQGLLSAESNGQSVNPDWLGQSKPAPTVENIGVGIGQGLFGNAIGGKVGLQSPAPMPINNNTPIPLEATGANQSPAQGNVQGSEQSTPQTSRQTQGYDFSTPKVNINPAVSGSVTTTPFKTPAEAKREIYGQYIPQVAQFLASKGHSSKDFMPFLLQDAAARLEDYTSSYNSGIEQKAYNDLEPLLTGDVSTPEARRNVMMGLSKYMQAMKSIGKDGSDISRLAGQLFANSNVELSREDNGGQYRYLVKDSAGNLSVAPGGFGEWQSKTMTPEQADSSRRGWEGLGLQKDRFDMDRQQFELENGMPSFESFVNAISGQESGGNYDARNGRTGAAGKYQIMPDNWPVWSQEAGLPANAAMTPDNQERVARFKLKQYYDKYGPRGAAIAWYAGEGALGYSADALSRKQGNGDEPSINEYADSIVGRIGQSGGKYVNIPGVGRITTQQALGLYENTKPQTTTTQNSMGETVRQTSGDPEMHDRLGKALGLRGPAGSVDQQAVMDKAYSDVWQAIRAGKSRDEIMSAVRSNPVLRNAGLDPEAFIQGIEWPKEQARAAGSGPRGLWSDSQGI